MNIFTLPCQINYHDVFRPLISVHEKFDILTLIEDDIEAIPSPSSGKSIFSTLFFRPRTKASLEADQNALAVKLFRRKIKNWSKTWDRELEAARFSPASLKLLQGVAQAIQSGNKIVLLSDKLNQLHLLTPKMETAITWLEQLVIRVLQAPLMEKLRNLSEVRAKQMSYPVLAGLFPRVDPNYAMKTAQSDGALFEIGIEGKSLDTATLQKEMFLESNDLARQQRANEICRFRPTWGKGWEGKLLLEFGQIKEESMLMALASKLNPCQALSIIDRITHDQKQEWKIIYLLGALEHTTFIEVLNALDKNLLTFTNQTLRNSPKESLDWFEKAVLRHRAEIINSCNTIGYKIDALAKRFRDDLVGHKLSEGDFLHITELKDNIDLRMTGIEKKLIPLIDGVITHPETNASLSEEVLKEYKSHLKRLTLTVEEANDPAGCLFPIILRNTFKRAKVKDEEEAFEIFADWYICSQENYWGAGLLGKINEATFHRITTNNANVYVVSRENLAKLGITTIADWKRLKIFNRTMLMNFLNKAENQDRLTRWTMETLR